ncbi:MAG: ATP-dependent DNA helicase, partial [Chryseobacterium sp.]
DLLLYLFQWGKITDAEPSRFLSEVDAEYLELLNPPSEQRFVNHSGLRSDLFDDNPPRFVPKKAAEPKKVAVKTPQKLTPVSSAKISGGGTTDDIAVGDRVRHDRFGQGTVEFLDGTDPQNIKAKVKFDHEGEKNLILKFAKLVKV